jgi:hypothetical protein
MISRAFGCLAAFAVAGFAFVATPAPAQAQCSYDHYRHAYNCHRVGLIAPVYQPVYQPSCTSCGNRGLFTSGSFTSGLGVRWGSPCGACQQLYPQTAYPAPGYVQPVVDDDYDDDVPQYRVRVRRTSYVHRPVRHHTVHRGPARHRERLPGGGY